MKITLLGWLRLAVTAGLTLMLTGIVFAAPFQLVNGTMKTLAPAALSAQKTETQGRVSSDKKTLTFGQNTIRLIVQTGPENDMLSYRIAGLRNPTLVMPKGALLHVLFVNTDDDMLHDLRFGAARKNFPNRADALRIATVGTSPLPHKSEAVIHGEEMTVRIPSMPGVYAYFCTVRGHAQGGMVGKVIVK